MSSSSNLNLRLTDNILHDPQHTVLLECLGLLKISAGHAGLAQKQHEHGIVAHHF